MTWHVKCPLCNGTQETPSDGYGFLCCDEIHSVSQNLIKGRPRDMSPVIQDWELRGYWNTPADY